MENHLKVYAFLQHFFFFTTIQNRLSDAQKKKTWLNEAQQMI